VLVISSLLTPLIPIAIVPPEVALFIFNEFVPPFDVLDDEFWVIYEEAPSCIVELALEPVLELLTVKVI
jgi:hypothetical protein